MPASYPHAAAAAHLTMPTPLGLALAVSSDGERLVRAQFCEAPLRPMKPDDPLLREAKRQVEAYFRKRLLRFDLPLRLDGTDFQKRVWGLVSGLQTGEMVSYADVARLLARPHAYRAVAAAMRATPFDLFIPAHRVVGSDGTVRGAGAGSVRRRLLAFEGVILR